MKKNIMIPILLVLVTTLASACTKQDSDGVLSIQGSDTIVQLVSNLAESFAASHPDVDISVTGGGSSVGIAALLNGETRIANASRPMKEEERIEAQSRGKDVQEFILARDGLSVIVHPSNPVNALTVDQIGGLYRGEVANWKDVGGTDAPVTLYGRQSTSGTFEYFRDTIVRDDYMSTMRQMEGNQAIVDAVAADRYGIGYVGVGYVRSVEEAGIAIKPLDVSRDDRSPAVSPLNREAVKRGEYPITRQVYQYLSALPVQGSILDLFLQFESSQEGQRIIEEAGFYPLNDEDAAENAELFRRMP